MLYEVFSMGDHPYITVQPDDMVEYLKGGHRLEKPEACPDPMLVYSTPLCFVRTCKGEDSNQ